MEHEDYIYTLSQQLHEATSELTDLRRRNESDRRNYLRFICRQWGTAYKNLHGWITCKEDGNIKRNSIAFFKGELVGIMYNCYSNPFIELEFATKLSKAFNRLQDLEERIK